MRMRVKSSLVRSRVSHPPAPAHAQTPFLPTELPEDGLAEDVAPPTRELPIAEPGDLLAGDGGAFFLISDPRLAQKASDAARLRRAHLAKYVRVVVASCALLCCAAVARAAIDAAAPDPAAPIAAAATDKIPVPPPTGDSTATQPVTAAMRTAAVNAPARVERARPAQPAARPARRYPSDGR
jgi:hypothetical protein